MQCEIKELEWDSRNTNTAFGVRGYWISEHLGFAFLLYDGEKIGQFGSVDHAKEKAQEHFEKQVMKFLNVNKG